MVNEIKPGLSPELKLTATYGRTKTYFASIIGSCFVLSFAFGGGFLIFSANKSKNKMKKITANVDSISRYGNKQYKIFLSFNIDNVRYSNTIISNRFLTTGTSLTIYYDINNPNNISEHSTTKTIIIGSVLIFIAIIICLSIIYSVYTVKNYDQAAINAAIPQYPYNTGFYPYNTGFFPYN